MPTSQKHAHHRVSLREVGHQFEPATARFRPCFEVKFILDAPAA